MSKLCPIMSRSPLLVIAIAAITLLVAACSSGDNTTTTPTPAAATSAASGATSATPLVAVRNIPKVGNVLTTANGMTLYTFKKDTTGKSNCAGTCAQTWPPLTTTAGSVPAVSGADGSFAIVKRDDGSMQVTYNGAPLYTYAADKQPGDANGQGVGGIWFVASASGAASSPVAPTTSAASGGGYNY